MKRLNRIDIARGIAIFFLVSMHVRYWPITRVYAMFDMALFFFISGYVFNGNKKVLPFVWGKIKRLYIPFVIGCGIYLAFHNHFYFLRITQYKFEGFKQYGKVFLDILLYNNQEDLLIQVWFLPALFFVTIIVYFSYKLLRCFLNEKWTLATLFVESGLFFAANALLGNRVEWWWCSARLVNCIASCMIFFVIGFCFRKLEKPMKIDIKNNILFGVLVCVLVGLIYAGKFRLDVRQNICSNWVLYPIIAIIGIYVTLYVAEIIDTYIGILGKALALIGKNTFLIFWMHPLVFKGIGLIQIHVLKMEYTGDLRIWGNVNTHGIWAFVYCALGIGIPLILKLGFDKVRILFVRKKNDC